MKLTKRQIELLVCLANTKSWINSEKLSESVHTNKKTVQTEIKSILEIYPDKIKIESNKRKGYRLLFILPDLQEKIALEMGKHQIYSSMNFRVSTIILYLLFQEEHVSMQKLADVFFLSKTAVSNEVKTIQRWVDRNEKLMLDISNQKGLKIIATENMRRIFASVVSTEAVLRDSNLPQQFIDTILQQLPIVKRILQRNLILSNYIISGEDYLIYARYVAISLARESEGNKVEKEAANHLLLPVIDNFVYDLQIEYVDEIGIDVIRVFGNRLLELNYLNNDWSQDLKVQQHLRQFEDQLVDFLGLPNKQLFKRTGAMVTHITKMEIRMAAGHNILNHFAQKTLSNYPLETYLVRRFFPVYFHLKPNLAELSYLVLYVAESLEDFKSGIETVLLVSNQSFSILNTLKRNLEDGLNKNIRHFQIEPTYVFESKKRVPTNLALTTEQEILFKNPDFYYIPSILTEDELEEQSRELLEQISKKKEHAKQLFLSKYYSEEENIVHIQKKVTTIHQLLSVSSGLEMWPVTSNCLFACEIVPDEETKIREYRFSEPILYQQKKIERLIYFTYKKSSTIFNDFSAIGELLVDRS